MPKTAAFKITKVPEKAKPFVVDIPATFSESGKRERKGFEKRNEANSYVAHLKEKLRRGMERELLIPRMVQ